MTENPGKKKTTLYIFCLIFLIQPNIHVIDLLPDLIAWAILAAEIRRAALICPYFEEARVAMHRLCLVGVLKLPAMLLILMVRRSNPADGDMIPTVAIVAALFDIVLSIGAIHHLFAGLFYLGQRSSFSVLLAPYASFGSTYTPEKLRLLAMAFALLKGLASCLPELLLLTGNSDMAGGAGEMDSGRFYPLALGTCMLLVLMVGILLLVRCIGYIQGICKENALHGGLTQLCDEARALRIQAEEQRRSLHTTLTLFSYAALLYIPVILRDFRGLNILPSCLFSGLLVLGFFRLRRQTKGATAGLIFACLCTVLSLVSFVTMADFAYTYGFEALLSGKKAQAAYRLPLALALSEGVLFLLLMVLTASVLYRFYRGLSHRGMEDGRFQRSLQRRFLHKTLLYAGVGGLCALSRGAHALLRMGMRRISTGSAIQGTEAVYASTLPWFPTAMFFLAVIFAFVSFWYFGTLKEEVDLALGEELTKESV